MARCASLNMEATRMAPLRQLHTPSATAFRVSPRTLRRATSLVTVSKRTQGKDIAAAGTVAAASLMVAAPAFASSAEEFAKALQSKLDAAAALTGQVTAAGSAAGSEAAKLAKSAADAVKPAVDFATPYVTKAANDAFSATAPLLREGASTVEKTVSSTLKSGGVDLTAATSASKVATDAASTVVTSASPLAKSLFQALTTSDPQTLAILTGAGVLFALLTPVWGPALAASIRGYAGDINAASSLDLVSQSKALMIDLRSVEEATSRGSPQLPRNANKIALVPLQAVVDKRLRGAMGGAALVEAESTAFVIAALKRVSKATPILLLDRNGGVSKQVAMALARMGFKKAFVIKGGFEGRGGWKQSSLASTAGTGIQKGAGSFQILGTGRFGSQKVTKALGSGSQKIIR